MSLADIALQSALSFAAESTARFYHQFPDAYETSLDHSLLFNVQRDVALDNERTLGDGSSYGIAVRFIGGPGGQLVDRSDPTKRVEVADLAILLKSLCSPTKLLLLQSKKFKAKSLPKQLYGGHDLDDLRAVVQRSMTNRRSFDSSTSYGSSRVNQWIAIAAVNRASRRLHGHDLIHYLFYHPPYYLGMPPSTGGTVGLRVVQQSDCRLRTMDASKIRARFGNDLTEFARFVIAAINCKFGIPIRGTGRLGAPYDAGGDGHLFDFGVTRADFAAEVDALGAEAAAKTFSFNEPILDLSECPTTIISVEPVSDETPA
jgi:hypothetical protein